MESIDVRDLLERPGSSREVHLRERLDAMRTELVSVPQELRIDLLLENVVQGILASGPVAGDMAFRCARCLKPSSTPFRVEISELFAPGAHEDDEEYPVDDEAVDLEPMIRDAVLLAMPFSPLCRPDCLGLCERCGGDRNLGECSCGPDIDPRWAPLQGLKLE